MNCLSSCMGSAFLMLVACSREWEGSEETEFKTGIGLQGIISKSRSLWSSTQSREALSLLSQGIENLPRPQGWSTKRGQSCSSHLPKCQETEETLCSQEVEPSGPSLCINMMLLLPVIHSTHDIREASHLLPFTSSSALGFLCSPGPHMNL